MPATDRMLQSLQFVTPICQKLFEYCQAGWPQRNQLSSDVRPYLSVSTELSLQARILMNTSYYHLPKLP